MRNRLIRSLCIGAACAGLASCGGGGGGGDGGGAAADTSSAITFTPSPVQVVQTQGFQEQISERMTISPEPAGSGFYAVFAADKPVVQTGQVFFTANADNSATVTMSTDPTLAPGSYAGQLTLHICRDTQCANEVSLTGNTLPYSITVLPRVQLQATGVVSSNYLGTPGSYVVNPGATVVVTSNIPVTWSQGGGISGASLQVISSTSTRWEGVVNGTSGKWVGLVGASIDKPANNTAAVEFNISN